MHHQTYDPYPRELTQTGRWLYFDISNNYACTSLYKNPDPASHSKRQKTRVPDQRSELIQYFPCQNSGCISGPEGRSILRQILIHNPFDRRKPLNRFHTSEDRAMHHIRIHPHNETVVHT